MRGPRGPRGFPRTVTGEAVSASGGAAVFDLDHRGIHQGSLVGYVSGVARTSQLLRGTGANGADQILFAASVGISAVTADYVYTPGL